MSQVLLTIEHSGAFASIIVMLLFEIEHFTERIEALLAGDALLTIAPQETDGVSAGST